MPMLLLGLRAQAGGVCAALRMPGGSPSCGGHDEKRIRSPSSHGTRALLSVEQPRTRSPSRRACGGGRVRIPAHTRLGESPASPGTKRSPVNCVAAGPVSGRRFRSRRRAGRSSDGERMASAMERSPYASSSHTSAPVTALRSPPPPQASGSALATSPSSWAWFSTSSGSARDSQHSCAWGRTSLAANCRTVSTISCCSSVGSKSIKVSPIARPHRRAGQNRKRLKSLANSPRSSMRAGDRARFFASREGNSPHAWLPLFEWEHRLRLRHRRSTPLRDPRTSARAEATPISRPSADLRRFALTRRGFRSIPAPAIGGDERTSGRSVHRAAFTRISCRRCQRDRRDRISDIEGDFDDVKTISAVRSPRRGRHGRSGSTTPGESSPQRPICQGSPQSPA